MRLPWPRTTVSSWRTRGLFNDADRLDVSDACSLALMKRLESAGLSARHAAELARDVRPFWGAILAPGSVRRFVANLRDPASARWRVDFYLEEDLGTLASDGLLLIDLRAVGESVLGRLDGRRAA